MADGFKRSPILARFYTYRMIISMAMAYTMLYAYYECAHINRNDNSEP